MSKVVVYQNADGNTVIVHPSPSLIARLGGIDEAIAALQSRADCVPPTAAAVSVRGKAEIPTDWTFRNAWKPDLTVDMPKARTIHQDRINRARDEKLKELTEKWSAETARGNTGQANALRAQINALDAAIAGVNVAQAATPDDLKAIWPDEVADKKPATLRRP